MVNSSRIIAACLANLAGLCLPASAQPTPPPPPPPAEYLAAQAAASSNWPHTLSKDGASITVYQPQAISWPNHQTLTARAAIAITQPGQDQPILGTIEVSLATSTDEAKGVIALSDPKLLDTHFPALDTQQATALQAKIAAFLPQMETHQVTLAAVLLSLKLSPVSPVAVNNDPPMIFYANHPASLVVFDGDPVLAPVGKTGLSFAVNTNWDIFVDHGSWYLLNNGVWLSAPAATGPYTPVTSLPAAFSTLPNNASFADARKHIPARPAPAEKVPTIFVSTKPAEIILSAGLPQFAPIPGTNLQRVVNTNSALFFDSDQTRFYVLLSGRWFAAPVLDGPWIFATDKLPPNFALIPSNSPEGTVLASVPGTIAAQEAVLKAQIPTTATLKRSAAKLTVVYAGPPNFQPIPGTTLLHAVNTSTVVLKIGDQFYACENGAWFAAASPTGPWKLADTIPPSIKTIPPSGPLYNVTYVQIYGATPTTVTYGYTAGYVMGFVSAGVLVYGTGYYYPPVILPGPVPIYYPYPYTYAGGVYYNTANGAWARGGTVYGPYGAATGAWAQGGAVYGPYGGAGAFSAYNPSTGSYAHGSAVWGGGSGTANASFYNAHTGVSGTTNQNADPYGRWGSSTFAGPNQTVNTQSRGNAQGSAGSFNSSTGAEGAGYHNRATGSSGGAVKTSNGDVYAGRDGNVYQHSDSGWSKYNDGAWNPVQPPANSGGRQPGTTEATPRTTQGGGSHSSIDNSSYQQLEQDRLGRQGGLGQFGQRGASGGGRRFRR